jgi:hypothetical protein
MRTDGEVERRLTARDVPAVDDGGDDLRAGLLGGGVRLRPDLLGPPRPRERVQHAAQGCVVPRRHGVVRRAERVPGRVHAGHRRPSVRRRPANLPRSPEQTAQIQETPLPLDLICHITPKQRIERNGRRNQGSSASKKERFLSCSPAAPNLGVPPPSRLASSGVLPSSSLLRRRCCIRLSRLLSLDPG